MEEKKIVSLVKKEKLENVILKLVLIVVCSMTLILNFDEYREVFLDNIFVYNNTTLANAINKDSKYITIDINEAKETRFSLENKGSEEAKIYQINYGEDNLILVLNKNTALTGKVQGELLSFDTNVKTIKEKLSEENDNAKYYDRYFSDMDYGNERKVTKRKFYLTTIIASILIISIIFDFVAFFHPKKTRMYKKIYKRMFKVKK